MTLSPLVRWLLTGLAAGVVAAATILADGFQPLDALLIAIPVLTSLGLIPAQRSDLNQHGVAVPVGVDTAAEKRRQRGEVVQPNWRDLPPR